MTLILLMVCWLWHHELFPSTGQPGPSLLETLNQFNKLVVVSDQSFTAATIRIDHAAQVLMKCHAKQADSIIVIEC